MTLPILFKVLDALAVVTDRVSIMRDSAESFPVGAYAMSLKQALEIMAKNPADAQQLNQLIMSSVCNDPRSFEEMGKLVAACLTQGKAMYVPQAIARFNEMASQVVIS